MSSRSATRDAVSALTTALENETLEDIVHACDALSNGDNWPFSPEQLDRAGILTTLTKCHDIDCVRAFLSHTFCRDQGWISQTKVRATTRKLLSLVLERVDVCAYYVVEGLVRLLDDAGSPKAFFTSEHIFAYALRPKAHTTVLTDMLRLRHRGVTIAGVARRLFLRNSPISSATTTILFKACEQVAQNPESETYTCEMKVVAAVREKHLGKLAGHVASCTDLECFVSAHLFLIAPDVALTPPHHACALMTMLDLEEPPRLTSSHFKQLALGPTSRITFADRDTFSTLLVRLCGTMTQAVDPRFVRVLVAETLRLTAPSRDEQLQIVTDLLSSIHDSDDARGNRCTGLVVAALMGQLGIAPREQVFTFQDPGKKISLEDATAFHIAATLRLPVPILTALFREHFATGCMHGKVVKTEVDNLYCRVSTPKRGAPPRSQGDEGGNNNTAASPAPPEFKAANVRKLCKIAANAQALTWLGDLINTRPVKRQRVGK